MKTIWVVDGAYILQANKPHGKIDYMRMKAFLETINGEAFFEGYYLNSTPNPPTDAQDGFHTWLKSAPPRGPKMRVQLYGLKGMELQCPSCNNTYTREVQKGVDVGIATLILKLASQGQYERIILTAGDGDFEDSIQYVKSELHKEIWICGFDGSVSVDLQSYADRVIWLDDSWDKIKR